MLYALEYLRPVGGWRHPGAVRLGASIRKRDDRPCARCGSADFVDFALACIGCYRIGGLLVVGAYAAPRISAGQRVDALGIRVACSCQGRELILARAPEIIAGRVGQPREASPRSKKGRATSPQMPSSGRESGN